MLRKVRAPFGKERSGGSSFLQILYLLSVASGSPGYGGPAGSSFSHFFAYPYRFAPAPILTLCLFLTLCSVRASNDLPICLLLYLMNARKPIPPRPHPTKTSILGERRGL